jgi:ABC-2 type transport system permease protein
MSIAGNSLKSIKIGKIIIAMLLIPCLIVSVVSYTFEGFGKEININIVIFDQGSANNSSISVSKTILSEISKESNLKIKNIFGSGDAISNPVNFSLDELRKGEIQGVIIFNSNFTNEVLAALASYQGKSPSCGYVLPASLTLYIDNSYPAIGNMITGEIQSVVQIVMGSQYHVSSPLRLNPNTTYGSQTTMFDFVGPGFACLMAMMLGLMLTGVSFISDRANIERSMNPQPTGGELIGGYAIYSGVIAAVQTSVIVGTLMLFSIEMNGNPFLVLLIVFLLMLVFQAIALFIAVISRNDPKVFIRFLPPLLFPSIVLTGLVVPTYMVGPILRPITYIHPLTYAIEGCRDVMIKGWGIGDVWFQLCVLILSECVVLTATIFVLKWRSKKETKG